MAQKETKNKNGDAYKLETLFYWWLVEYRKLIFKPFTLRPQKNFHTSHLPSFPFLLTIYPKTENKKVKNKT